MTTAARLQNPSISEQVKSYIPEIGMSAFSGALAGYMFTLASPVGGAMFGATFGISTLINSHLYDKVDGGSFIDKCVSKIEEHFPNTGMDSKVIQLILQIVMVAIPLFTVSTSLSYLVIGAAGFSMTLGCAFKMALAIWIMDTVRSCATEEATP